MSWIYFDERFVNSIESEESEDKSETEETAPRAKRVRAEEKAVPQPQRTVSYTDTSASADSQSRRQLHARRRVGRPVYKSRQWILEKKERQRRKGRTVRADTKYTGRRRKHKF